MTSGLNFPGSDAFFIKLCFHWRPATTHFPPGATLMFLVGLLIISTTQLLPQIEQGLMGYDALTAGMTLGAGGDLLCWR